MGGGRTVGGGGTRCLDVHRQKLKGSKLVGVCLFKMQTSWANSVFSTSFGIIWAVQVGEGWDPFVISLVRIKDEEWSVQFQQYRL